MDDRKQTVKCACGHGFDIAAEHAFQDVACPKCGKVVPAPTASKLAAQQAGPKTDPLAPKTDSTRTPGPKTDGPRTPGRPGPKTDPLAPKAPAPGTTRRPASPKEAPLPAAIPGYSFVKRLGQGGMGEVFLAKQESLDRLVAIKLLPPEFSKDKVYVESFMKEARSAGKATHENIMGAVDVGESNGRYYFVMEYVAGETLYRQIRQQKTIPEARALEIARQVARGLRHAHQQGLIHRDIKPQNILITAEGGAKICDFGLATEIKSSDAQQGEDEENVHTTPAYASPEQCQALPLDHRTDIYSLGVTLYEMLSGRRPFIADTPRALMTKQVSDAPQPPKSLNPAISEAANQLVLKMLRKSKDERPKSCDELIAALDGVLKSPSPRSTRSGAPDAPAVPAVRRPALLISAGAAASLLLVVGLIFAFKGKTPPPETTSSTGASNLDPEIQRRLDDQMAFQKRAQGRPGEYAAVRAKWKALEEKYPQWAIFANKRQDFEAFVNDEAQAAANAVLDEAARALQDAGPADATAALRRFPAEYSGTPAAARVSAKLADIERAVDDRYRDEIQSIQSLVSSDRLDEARQKLMNLRASSALDAATLKPQIRTQMDDLLRRIDAAIADAKKKTVEPVVKDIPSAVKAPDPKVPDSTPVTPGPAPVKGPKSPAEAPALPPAAAPHFVVLRDPAERSAAEKRAAAAAFFAAGAAKSAFHHAAAVFLSREDAAWKLQGSVAEGLQDYLASTELNRTEAVAKGEFLTPDRHLKLLELLVQKIAASGGAPVDALQLFACAHLQEILARKGKIDPALLLQAKFAKGPISDLWGPATHVVRVETASLLLKPPGLWVSRAADSASTAADFPTRYLGALCLIKDATFDAAPAIERWKKISAGSPDPAAWTKLGDAVADRIKEQTSCELCLGQGRFPCTACNAAGILVCTMCRGAGKYNDAAQGGTVTCTLCKGKKISQCTLCLGQKGMKCTLCDGKKTRASLSGSLFRPYLDLGLCDTCGGSGNLFSAVIFPCPTCDGYGRSMDAVIREYSRLPAWALKGREGRLLMASLRWLARHQSPEGNWSTTAWSASCPEPGCKGEKAGAFDIGLTSVTLVAFLNAGFGPESIVEIGNVNVGAVVRKAIAWLEAQQQPQGEIAHAATLKPVYENILATWALFTASTMIQPSEAFSEKDRTQMRDVALRGLRYTLTNQAKGAGWGYTVGAPSDTWVTSWGAMSMLAAREAGAEIPRVNLGHVLQWLDAVTDKKDYHIGYTAMLMGVVNLTGNESYLHHDTLSAFGSLVRLQLEGKPTATYAATDKLLQRDLPNGEPLRRDYCYWYFGTVFSAYHEQRRGTAWTQWSQALLRELVTLQETADSCALGSFPSQERWCLMGGHVYATAMNALTLTQLMNTRPAAPTKR